MPSVFTTDVFILYVFAADLLDAICIHYWRTSKVRYFRPYLRDVSIGILVLGGIHYLSSWRIYTVGASISNAQAYI